MNDKANRFELLSIEATPAQAEILTDNILKVFELATPGQFLSGMHWYETAHDLADMVGFGDVSKGAGLIAALSANTGWTQNRKLAELIAHGKAGEVKHFGAVMSKVEKILGGADPEDVLGGQKTLNFYRNIRDPYLCGPVTVDRHAHDVARGQVFGSHNRGLTTMARYDAIAEAYREAADVGGILPHEMQAVTWEVWRDMISHTSTRGQL